MRASVSDIVTFRKCPRLWKYRQQWAPEPSKYMERGTLAHRQVQTYLSKRMSGYIHAHAVDHALLDSGTSNTPAPLMQRWDYNQLETMADKFNILAVERPFEFDFLGHTLLGRPDALLQEKTLFTERLFQIKTVSRKLSAHELSVQQHPYETAYATAVGHFLDKPINRTLLMRIFFDKHGVPDIELMDVILPVGKARQEILDSLVHTLDEMDRYAQKSPEEVPAYTNSCIDWNTGAKCPFLTPCRYGHNLNYGAADFALLNIQPAKDRYDDLGEIYKPGGSGDSNPPAPNGNP